MAYATTTQVLNAVQKMKDYHDTHSSKQVYEEEINIPNREWVIQHNLDEEYWKLKIDIIDSDGNIVYGSIDLDITTTNLLVIKFNAEIQGKICITK